MSVTVDQNPLAAEEMGMQTVGQVLAHLQRDNRLVVHVLIDGQEPDLDQAGSMRRAPLLGHTVYIETAEPRQMAAEVLAEVQNQLAEADALKSETVELLCRKQNFKAMEKLSGCFGTWHHAQESVLKTAQLLRIDLNDIKADGRSLQDLLKEFTHQLRQIKTALENRDFVCLRDILIHETTQTSRQWHAALDSMSDTVARG